EATQHFFFKLLIHRIVDRTRRQRGCTSEHFNLPFRLLISKASNRAQFGCCAVHGCQHIVAVLPFVVLKGRHVGRQGAKGVTLEPQACDRQTSALSVVSLLAHSRAPCVFKCVLSSRLPSSPASPSRSVPARA